LERILAKKENPFSGMEEDGWRRTVDAESPDQ
jgi:hypothetical protein